MASLGNAHLATHPATTNAALLLRAGRPFLSSGGRLLPRHRARLRLPRSPAQHRGAGPLLRPARPQGFIRLSQAQYDAATVITEADVDLIDVTTRRADDPAGATGSRLDRRRRAAVHGREEPRRGADDREHDPAHDVRADSASTTASASPAGVGTNRPYTISAYTGARSMTARARKTRRTPLTTATPSSPRAAWRRKWSSLPEPGEPDDLRRRGMPPRSGVPRRPRELRRRHRLRARAPFWRQTE